jgi:hypothetical protein
MFRHLCEHLTHPPLSLDLDLSRVVLRLDAKFTFPDEVSHRLGNVADVLQIRDASRLGDEAATLLQGNKARRRGNQRAAFINCAIGFCRLTHLPTSFVRCPWLHYCPVDGGWAVIATKRAWVLPQHVAQTGK